MSGIYVASKATRSAQWIAYRASGYPICSTWIDEAGPGQTLDWVSLWARCIVEVRTSDVLIVHYDEGELLKGALVEVGAALSNRVPVLWVGPRMSVCAHPLVTVHSCISQAMNVAQRLYREAMTA